MLISIILILVLSKLTQLKQDKKTSPYLVMFFYNKKKKNMGISEYKNLKQNIEELARVLNEKKDKINSGGRYYKDAVCFCEYTETLPAYSDFIDMIEFQHKEQCSHIDKSGECKITSCPNYQAYQEYYEIKKMYDKKVAKLDCFPLRALINPPKVK